MELTKTKYKTTEVGFIPEDWTLEPIADFASITTGGSDTQDKIDDGEYPFYVRSNQVERINKYTFDGEAILTSGDGVGVGKVFHYVDGKFDFHQRVYNIYGYRENVDGKYLFFQFSTNFFDRVMSMTAKSSVDSVRREMIADMLIPLPPTLTEQKAIATALSDVDALISSLERLIAKKKAIKQGAMQELLTPPNKGGKRLPGFSGEWEEKCFSEIADVRDGTHDSPKYVDNGIKFITSKNIVNNKLSFSDVSLISEKDAVEINKRSKVDKGDILMSMIGTIGSAVLIEIEPDFCIKNVALLKPYICRINTSFLFQKLTSPSYQQYILGKLEGGIQKFISLGMLRNLKIELPSQIEEQKAIAQILSDMDLEIEGLEAKKAKYQDIKQGMMQELLTGKTRLV